MDRSDLAPRLSRRAAAISPSPTIRVAAIARALMGEGRDIVDFSVGEPDFPTPAAACEAARRAIDAGRTGYTANEGIAELRGAVSRKLERENGVVYDPADILVSCGAKASLFLAAMTLLDDGDEAILFSPYWVSYPEQIRLAGASPVVVETRVEDGFRPDPRAFEAAITPRTRAVILNFPCNPTGATCSVEHLGALVDVALARDLWIISDEIYERLTFDGRVTPCAAAVSARARSKVVVINGMSKAYAMTGWRIGFAAGPRAVIRAMANLQSHQTGNATSVAQWAAVGALEGDGRELRDMVSSFARRRDFVHEALTAVPGIRSHRPEGTFYAFPDVRAYLGPGLPTSVELAVQLLETEGVAVVPGEAFGAAGHVRISFATAEERVREGLIRIARAFAAIGRG